MAGETLIRKISLAGWTGDTDWTDPANTPPTNAPRLKFTDSVVHFAVVGKLGLADDAENVDVGALTIDAWLGIEVGGQMRRDASIVEATSAPLDARIRFFSAPTIPGQVGRLNIVSLDNVGELPALWVYLISGARRL